MSLTRGIGMPRVARSTAPCACCSLAEGSASAVSCISPASAAPPPSMAILSSARRFCESALFGIGVSLHIAIHEFHPESLRVRHEERAYGGADEGRVVGL